VSHYRDALLLLEMSKGTPFEELARYDLVLSELDYHAMPTPRDVVYDVPFPSLSDEIFWIANQRFADKPTSAVIGVARGLLPFLPRGAKLPFFKALFSLRRL